MEALKVIQALLEYAALAAYSPEMSPRHCWKSSPSSNPTSNAWDGAFRKGHLKHLGQQSSTPYANPEQVLHLIYKVH